MKKGPILIWIAVYALLLFLSFNRHAHDSGFNYHNEFWSDKSGYNVYLPALFIYGFDAQDYPPDIDYQTGRGFRLDTLGKMVSKYPVGLAFLEAPFFATAHLLSNIDSSVEADGFSYYYQKSLNVAVSTYFLLALLLLYHIWRSKFRKSHVIWALVLMTLGTNLYHYVTFETGLSHAYSLFLFSVFLYLLNKKAHLGWIILTASFIFAVRYTNILFFPVAFILIPYPLNIKWDLKLLVLIGISSIPHLAQFSYNYFIHGQFFANTYGNEGFIYWNNPKILNVLFAPENGLLLYSPLWILLLIIAIPNRNKLISSSLLVLFGLILYMYSSWWSFKLGCGFGHRGFIEYLPLFFTLGLMKARFWTRRQLQLVLAFGLICVLLNLKLTYTFDYCFAGNHPWDWLYFKNLLINPPK